RARVVVAGGDTYCTTTERHVTGRRCGLVVADHGGVAVAELAVLVASPATDRARLEPRARMVRTRRELDRAAAERDGAGNRRGLVVADVVGVAVAERTKRAEAPAAHGPRGQARTRMVDAERQLDGLLTQRNVAGDRRGLVIA